jgi:hypothetical protein
MNTRSNAAPVVTVVNSSLVCRALSASARTPIVIWRALGRADVKWPQGGGPALPSSHLRNVAARSWLIIQGRRLSHRMECACERASVVRRWRRLADCGQALSAPAAVRLAGIFLMAAQLTNLTVVAAMPVRLRPAMPGYVAMTIAGLAVVMIAASGSVARAWLAWKQR